MFLNGGVQIMEVATCLGFTLCVEGGGGLFGSPRPLALDWQSYVTIPCTCIDTLRKSRKFPLARRGMFLKGLILLT